MTGLTFDTSFPVAAQRAAARPARPSVAVAPAPLTSAEQSRIADAFPPRPAVAQTLYGADRSVQTSTPLGSRLDLTA